MTFHYSRVLALTVVIMAGGCSFRHATTGMAIDYNEFVAQTTNRQTLLNILRSREREPMHFTSFGLVRGTVRGQANLEAGATIPNDTASTVAKSIVSSTSTTNETTRTDNLNDLTVTPKASLQVSTGTDFDIAINATDDFYRGIMNPIKESLVVHLLKQGYPADLLSHLLIRELRFSAVFKKDGKPIDRTGAVWVSKPNGPEKYPTPLVLEIGNAPDDADVSAFEHAIDCRNLSITTETRDKRSIPIDDISVLGSIAPEVLQQVQHDAARDSDNDAPRYSYEVKGSTGYTLALSKRRNCDAFLRQLLASSAKTVQQLARDSAPLEKEDLVEPIGGPALEQILKNALGKAGRESAEPLKRSLEIGDVPDPQGKDAEFRAGEYEFVTKNFFDPLLEAQGLKGYTGDLVIDLTFRSVQGVIYYLGEYIRKPGNSPKLHDAAACLALGQTDPCIPIIVVDREDKLRASKFVEVEYRGTRYAVPLSGPAIGPTAGRSSHTISLVQQLLNLHRTSKDLPSTPLVRVAN